MSGEIFVTVAGRLGADPARIVAASGTPYTRFRLATNARRRNVKGEWENEPTTWLEVVVFRDGLARNAAECLRKGDPVVVYGRLRCEERRSEDGAKQYMQLTVFPDVIGHDLNFGSSRFAKTVFRADSAGEPSSGPAGTDDFAQIVPPDDADDDAALVVTSEQLAAMEEALGAVPVGEE